MALYFFFHFHVRHLRHPIDSNFLLTHDFFSYELYSRHAFFSHVYSCLLFPSAQLQFLNFAISLFFLTVLFRLKFIGFFFPQFLIVIGRLQFIYLSLFLLHLYSFHHLPRASHSLTATASQAYRIEPPSV